MGYRSITIAATLNEINRQLYIPGIQRPYVWDPDQITRLFDSLMQRYPISTLLYWELQPENRADWEIYNFVRDFRQGDIHNDHAELEDNKPITLVLDGQQRLTSLLIGLTGSYTRKLKHQRKIKDTSWITELLYIDLAHIRQESDDDAVVDLHYRFSFFDERTPPRNTPDELWFELSFIMSADSPEALHQLETKWIDANPQLASELKVTARANLRRLWKMVWEDDAVAFYTERSQSYDKVLDIFIRANDGGTKLSRSDLLMSVITLRWDQFNARDETEGLIAELTETLQPPRAIEREFILRSCLFICDLDFQFQIQNFTPANIRLIEQHWVEIKRSLLFTASILRTNGLFGENLASHNIVMLVGYYAYWLNRTSTAAEHMIAMSDQERIRRWVVMFIFQGLLSLQTSTTFKAIRNVLREARRHGTEFPAEALVEAVRGTGRTMGFDDEWVHRYCRHGETEKQASALVSFLYGAPLPFLKRRPLPLVQSRFLMTEVLLGARVPDGLIPLVQSLRGTLQLTVALTEAEERDYIAMDFEEWIRSQPDSFFETHALPPDRSLYRIDRLLELAAERRQIFALRLQNALRDVLAPSQVLGNESAPANADESLESL